MPAIEDALHVAPWAQQTSETQGAAAAEELSTTEDATTLGTTAQLAIALSDSLQPGEKILAKQLSERLANKAPSQLPLIVVDGSVVDIQHMSQLRNEDIESITVLKGESATSVWGSRGANGAICVVTKEFQRRVQQKEIIADTCTSRSPRRNAVLPKYPGGEVELSSFIARNVRYPQEALNKGVSGRVLVIVGVNTDGSVEVLDATGTEEKSLLTAAMEVVKKIPKMIPGTIDGKPVVMTMQIPVTFVLQ